MQRDDLSAADRFDDVPPPGSETDYVIEASSEGPRSNRLPIEWFSEIRPALSSQWLIKKLLPASAIAVLYGHPGCGKSFLALDWAFHVALGWDWQGRKVQQGLVVYIGAEGMTGLRNRVVAFRQHHEIPSSEKLPLAFVPAVVDLMAPDADTPRVIELIKRAAADCGSNPAFVVIDTLSKTMGAGKENTDDMAIYVANCQRIAEDLKCCVMPVHHRPKDAEGRDARGHGSLRGGVDTMVIVEAGQPRTATVVKQKDAEEGDRFLFSLVPVELGQDDDGDTVTSCVLSAAERNDLTPHDPLQKAISKLRGNNQIAYKTLVATLVEEGEPVPDIIPEAQINRNMRTKVTKIDAWRERAMSAFGTNSDTKPDSNRRNFDRARKYLQTSEIIGIFNEYVWEI